MLNYQENLILNIFIESYLLNYNNIINYKKDDLNIIFDNIHIPDKIINIFLNKSFNSLNIILELSILYSLGYDEKSEHLKFINYLEYYKNDINDINKLSIDFKRNIVYKSISLLLDKKNRIIDLYELDNVKDKYKSLFKYINNNIRIYTLNDIEKEIIYKIMCKYEIMDIELVIKDLINTSKYDNDISYNNFINNEKDILIFKQYIIRKMLFDNYIVEYKDKEDTINEYRNNIKNDFIFDNYIKNFRTPFDKYINFCLKDNKFYLPKDKELLDSIYNRYCYLFYYPDKEYEYIKNINKKDEKILLKINPYYKFY